MIAITNPKVAGFAPQWAPFPGFSLLFDNPLDDTLPLGDRLRLLDCQVSRRPETRFYHQLVAGLDEIGTELLTQTYLFCPTPPSTYHVTVWDGLNAGNATRVAPEQVGPLYDFLQQIKSRFGQDTKFTAEAASSRLQQTAEWRITMRLHAVEKWDNIGLAARLAPADDASRLRLSHMVEARRALTAAYQSAFGVIMSASYTPHVTLGYFANRQQAELASPQLPAWNEHICRHVGDETITFDRISLYGFTDMITFFKQ